MGLKFVKKDLDEMITNPDKVAERQKKITEKWVQVRLRKPDSDGYNYSGNGGRSWVLKESENIDTWPTEEAAVEEGKKSFIQSWKYKKDWDVVKLEDTVSMADSDDYDIRREKGHYEVYRGSTFIGSADDRKEAEEVIEEDKARRAVDNTTKNTDNINDSDDIDRSDYWEIGGFFGEGNRENWYEIYQTKGEALNGLKQRVEPAQLESLVSLTNTDDHIGSIYSATTPNGRGMLYIKRQSDVLIDDSKKLKDADHKFYIVEYLDEKGWSPAEGGTIYYAGKRFIRKIGPFNTPEEAGKKLDEFEADANADAKEDEQLKVYRPDIRTLIIYDNGLEIANYYHIERDDRWGSKQTSGGGWDWSPEKNPVKHPSKEYYYFIDKSTGEVLMKEKDKKKFANFVHDYVLDHVSEWRKENPDKSGIDFLNTFEVNLINSINGKAEKFDVMEILQNAYPY